MTKPRLTYFDAPTSRGEECRLAFHLAGVDFEDAALPRLTRLYEAVCDDARIQSWYAKR